MVARERSSRVASAAAARPVAGAGVRLGEASNGAIREQLSDIQCARIVNATFDVSCERGAGNVSVAHIVQRAGVSRRTFYELFRDRDECFLAAFEQALEYACERVLPAYESQKDWREKIRASLLAFLSFLDEEPAIGRVLIVESVAAGSGTLARRSEIAGLLTGVVDQGRTADKATGTVPPLTGEGIVGGVLSVIHTRLSASEHEPLVELAKPLMSMIVLPYLGAAAARKELERPMPEPSVKPRRTQLLADPFKDTGLRLTYRTVRVLAAISDHPGASNRLIGDTAEIKDQGQISKLLMRLQRAGMITNTGLPLDKGAPNRWALTDTGQQVVTTIRAHTEGLHRAGEP